MLVFLFSAFDLTLSKGIPLEKSLSNGEGLLAPSPLVEGAGDEVLAQQKSSNPET